jgi:predicted acyl esterase
VCVDEGGIGQSPGIENVISRENIDGFFNSIEWAAEQPWSSGKIGLLGLSYYAPTQWHVAARHPKGL